MELPAPSSDAYGGLSCVDAPAVVCDRVQELDNLSTHSASLRDSELPQGFPEARWPALCFCRLPP